MAKRRANSEGSVFQDESGRWVAMIELPRRPDGRRQRKKRRARTRAEAQRLLREMRDELNTAKVVTNARRTIGDAIADYQAAREAQGLSKGTLDQSRWQLEVIGEALGRRRTATLTVADCDGFLEAAAQGIGERRPISRAHIGRIRFTLINVLANEIRVGHLTRNVAELSILPATTVEKKERRALTHDELSALLSVAKGSRLVLIDLSARNGLRPAEARALRWEDVDLELGVLTVSGQLDRQNRRTKPKTKKSARSLQLDETTTSRPPASTGRTMQVRQRSSGPGAPGRTSTLIVAATARGNPSRPSLVRQVAQAPLRRGGIDPPISPYELRHTAITMQADAGHSSWEIADWAGTSETMIADVYRHRLLSVSRLVPARLAGEGPEVANDSRRDCLRPSSPARRYCCARRASQELHRLHARRCSRSDNRLTRGLGHYRVQVKLCWTSSLLRNSNFSFLVLDDQSHLAVSMRRWIALAVRRVAASLSFRSSWDLVRQNLT